MTRHTFNTNQTHIQHNLKLTHDKTHNKFTKHSSPDKIILSKDTSSKLELCQTVTAQDPMILIEKALKTSS